MDNSLRRLSSLMLDKQNTKQEVRYLTGVFVSTESVDSNLSKVTLSSGDTVRWVRKYKSVGSMSAGDTLDMKTNGSTYIIVGIIVGDHTLADIDM